MTKKRSVLLAFVLIALVTGMIGFLLGKNEVPASRAKSKQEKTDKRPNVVFIVLDVVRSDHLAICGYGRPTSGALDMLVNEGAVITCRAYAPGTWTLPSHASFFTGKEVPEHRADSTIGTKGQDGVITSRGFPMRPLGPELETLAEVFKERGYETIAVSGNPVVSNQADTGLLRGFDIVRESEIMGDLFGLKLIEALQSALEEADPNKPKFLFINVCDAHTPWWPIPPGLPWVPPRRGLKYVPFTWQNPFVRFANNMMPPQEREFFKGQITDLYDYAVFRADKTLEGATKLMRASQLFSGNFRLVVVGDHGEFLGEHDLVGHGIFSYEPNNLVPILYLDNKKTELSLPNPMAALHAYDLVLDGRMPDKQRPIRTIGYPAHWEQEWFGERELTTMASLWVGNDKLTWKNGEWALYNLALDPGEENPLPLGEENPHFEEFSEFVEHALEAGKSTVAQPTSQMIEALRKLGYLNP